MLPLRLALREIGYWRVSAACQIALIAGVVAPVLLLYALQYGVTRDLRAYFESTPDNLRLFPSRSSSRDDAWFARWSADGQVGFLAPHPYSGAVELPIRSEGASQGIEAVLLASGPGDLMLPPGIEPPRRDEAVLTATLAQSLSVSTGDTVRLVADRPDTGETSEWRLKIIGVAPRSRWSDDGALVHVDVVKEAWRWRQGYASSMFGLSGDIPPDGASYPRFRMYARNLSDLQPLAARLKAEGVDVFGNFADAELADSVEASTAAVLAGVFIAAVAGALAALAASLLADAERLRPALLMLRVDGLSRSGARAVLVWKSLILAAAGWAFGALICLCGLIVANAGISAAGLPFETTGRLPIAVLPASLLACVFLAGLIGAAASYAALRQTAGAEDSHVRT